MSNEPLSVNAPHSLGCFGYCRLVPYCSSDSWSGASTAGGARAGSRGAGQGSGQTGSSFSFMGALIVQEVVRDLVTLGLHNESHILLAGTRYSTNI